jgi:hypothetical protein
LVNGRAGPLPDYVPQRHFDTGQRQVGEARVVGEAPEEAGVAHQALDVERRPALEERRHPCQRGKGRLGGTARRRLAISADALVCFYLDEQVDRAVVDAARPVVGLFEPEREGACAQGCDLHE